MSAHAQAARRFVVPAAGRREAAGDARPQRGIEVEALDGDTDVVVLSAGSRGGWRAVAEHTGAPWVAPVLVDDREHESYPTGEVVVRFVDLPSDTALRSLEREEQVRVLRRNEFVPNQVVLAPVEPHGMYLPDLCARVERRDDVAAVWLGTKSRYTKG